MKLQFLKNVLKVKLYAIWSAFLKIFGRIKIFPYPFFIVYNPKGYRLNEQDELKILNTVQPGDVLIRGYVDFLDVYFIPGLFSHVGIYIGDGKVLHSMQDGVFEESIYRFLRCDMLVIARPNLNSEEISIVINNAKSFIGIPYDFSMNFDCNKRMSCTEFVANSMITFHDKLGIDYMEKKLFFSKKIYHYIIPDNFFEYKGFQIIFQDSFSKTKKNFIKAKKDF
ncbi:MAG: YiiX/YebB-like N1pC/P60 family cysteine hydrolase [Candidatus Nanoarchaeia archaeon]|nr:YiiX/YebB-like N1pC/P60 family cysteine hydrolase [Candidatus Nanoarchaeia archaeon]